MSLEDIGPLAKLELIPREQAELLYDLYRQPRSFLEDVALHQVSGYVIDLPGVAFLMGRGVDRYVDEEAIRSPQVIFPRSRQNAWFIWVFCGPLEKMLELAPYELPYVGWTRRNGPIRWYRCEEFEERVSRYGRGAIRSAS